MSVLNVGVDQSVLVDFAFFPHHIWSLGQPTIRGKSQERQEFFTVTIEISCPHLRPVTCHSEDCSFRLIVSFATNGCESNQTDFLEINTSTGPGRFQITSSPWTNLDLQWTTPTSSTAGLPRRFESPSDPKIKCNWTNWADQTKSSGSLYPVLIGGYFCSLASKKLTLMAQSQPIKLIGTLFGQTIKPPD
jgi:hypothetical protein